MTLKPYLKVFQHSNIGSLYYMWIVLFTRWQQAEYHLVESLLFTSMLQVSIAPRSVKNPELDIRHSPNLKTQKWTSTYILTNNTVIICVYIPYRWNALNIKELKCSLVSGWPTAYLIVIGVVICHLCSYTSTDFPTTSTAKVFKKKKLLVILKRVKTLRN